MTFENPNQDLIFKHLIESLPYYIFWKNRDSVYLGCNQNFSDLLGEAKENIIGKTDNDLSFQKEEAASFREADKKVMNGKVQVNLEESLKRADGTEMTVLVSKVPIKNADDEVIGLLGMSTDITPQKEVQKELEQERIKAEAASAAKSNFIANMSHDIRTPITGIFGMLQDLQYSASDTQSDLKKSLSMDQQRELLQELTGRVRTNSNIGLSALNELLQLCNEILDVVRLESGKVEEIPEAFDLIALVQHNIDLLRPVAQHQKLMLSVEMDKQLPYYVYGLRQCLDRTLLNLISNALKFTKKGFVIVTVSVVEHAAATYSKGDKVVVAIKIEDTGIGIPENKLDEIFEHFSRLTAAYHETYKGSGLGLYTVKQYVAAMNGRIDVESEVDKGSCFTLTLPFTVDDHEDRVHESTGLTESIVTMPPVEVVNLAARILLVEDQPAAAMAARLVLNRLQCSVDVANNGAEGVKKAGSGTYDLIFMDVGLPDMDGLAVTKKIRALSDAKKSQVPIIGLTGHAGEDKRDECIGAGMNDVLIKPAKPLALQTALQNWVWGLGMVEAMSDADTLAVIDWNGCVKACMNDESFVRELLSMMADDLKITQQRLSEAYPKKDMKALREELHRCLGGVVYLRLPQLEHAIKALQTAVKAELQDPDALETTYNALQNAIEAFWKTHKEGKWMHS